MDRHIENLSALALDALPQPVLLVRVDGKVLHRNAAAAGELPGGDDLASVLQSPEDASGDAIAAAVDSLAAGQSSAGQPNVPLVKAGGRRMTADLYFAALGELWGEKLFMVSITDVSARVSMERRLAVSRRLAGDADRSAELAHELSNPLDGVMRYLGLARRVAGDDAEQYIQGALGGLARMADALRSLRESGGGGRRLPVETLLQDAVGVMSPRADAAGVEIVGEFSGCDSDAGTELFQVFCNIIRNALDAMADGGVLKIRAAVSEGQCVVEFSDTGCGVSEQQCRLMFEPFYTTKPADGGVGLGLAISREIVHRVGGGIDASPGRGGGTVVTVRLPAGRRAASVKTE